MASTIGVGQEIVVFCKKCGLDLAHVIVTMKSPTVPGKVQCKTCDSVHTFKEQPKAGAKKKRSKKKSQKEVHSEEWTDRVGNSKESGSTYSPKKIFSIDEIIDHPTFGKGIVKRVIDNNKIEVAFEQESKYLVHNR